MNPILNGILTVLGVPSSAIETRFGAAHFKAERPGMTIEATSDDAYTADLSITFDDGPNVAIVLKRRDESAIKGAERLDDGQRDALRTFLESLTPSTHHAFRDLNLDLILEQL